MLGPPHISDWILPVLQIAWTLDMPDLTQDQRFHSPLSESRMNHIPGMNRTYVTPIVTKLLPNKKTSSARGM